MSTFSRPSEAESEVVRGPDDCGDCGIGGNPSIKGQILGILNFVGLDTDGFLHLVALGALNDGILGDFAFMEDETAFLTAVFLALDGLKNVGNLGIDELKPAM